MYVRDLSYDEVQPYNFVFLEPSSGYIGIEKSGGFVESVVSHFCDMAEWEKKGVEYYPGFTYDTKNTRIFTENGKEDMECDLVLTDTLYLTIEDQYYNRLIDIKIEGEGERMIKKIIDAKIIASKEMSKDEESKKDEGKTR